jgi:predicted nucleic acid-binding protein
MRPLLDINVALDALLGRDPWRVEAEAIWDANQAGRINAAISATSLPTIFYVIRKQADLARAHTAIENCLQSLDIVSVDRPTLELARTMTGSDFEDNLQVACAVVARLDAIVTRDPRGFAGSPVPVYSPAELLARLPKAEDA